MLCSVRLAVARRVCIILNENVTAHINTLFYIHNLIFTNFHTLDILILARARWIVTCAVHIVLVAEFCAQTHTHERTSERAVATMPTTFSTFRHFVCTASASASLATTSCCSQCRSASHRMQIEFVPANLDIATSHELIKSKWLSTVHDGYTSRVSVCVCVCRYPRLAWLVAVQRFSCVCLQFVWKIDTNYPCTAHDAVLLIRTVGRGVTKAAISAIRMARPNGQ